MSEAEARFQLNVAIDPERRRKLDAILDATKLSIAGFFRETIDTQFDAIENDPNSISILGRIVDNKIVLNQYGMKILKEAMTSEVKVVTDADMIEREYVRHDVSLE